MSLGIEEISVHEGGEEHADEHLGAQRLVGLRREGRQRWRNRSERGSRGGDGGLNVGVGRALGEPGLECGGGGEATVVSGDKEGDDLVGLGSGKQRAGALVIGSTSTGAGVSLCGEEILLKGRIELADVMNQTSIMCQIRSSSRLCKYLCQLSNLRQMITQFLSLPYVVLRVRVWHSTTSLASMPWLSSLDVVHREMRFLL
jgi:hypothetical protein